MTTLPPSFEARIAQVALVGIERRYPYKPGHTWHGPDDGVAPEVLHPIFCGCFDWHSAVHAHWTLARLLRQGTLDAEVADAARRRLTTAITPEAVAVERAYFATPGRAHYEWPYGWAWVVALGAELRTSDDPALVAAGDHLRPLTDLLFDRVAPRLTSQLVPNRVGTHGNTAFALELMWDAAPGCGRPELRPFIAAEARRFYGADEGYPWAYEPSAHDFLSPGLAAIGVMRRVSDRDVFEAWLTRYGAPRPDALQPIVDLDPSDGWFAHLVGLDLSRAWELAALADHLPRHPAADHWRVLARGHRQAALGTLFSGHYEADHWIGTFAVYGATSV